MAKKTLGAEDFGPSRASARRAAREQARADVADPVKQARAAASASAARFRKQLQEQGVLKGEAKPQSAMSKLSLLHQAYASNMVMSLVAPLAKGANGTAVMNVLGMGVALWALSPNFRSIVGDYGRKASDMVGTKLAERRTKALGKERASVEKRMGEFDPASPTGRFKRFFTSDSRRDKLMTSWEAQLNHISERERGGVPFTPASAALTHVGLAEAAHYEMRQPGADIDQVQANYDTAVTGLYSAVVADNVPDDPSMTDAEREAQTQWVVNQTANHSRLLIAQLMESDPAFGQVFAEVAHGAITKAPASTVVDPSTGQAYAHPGSFETVQGMQVKVGAFSVRPPLSAEEHSRRFTAVVVRDMIDEQGVEAIDKTLRGYAWGADASTLAQVHPEQADSPEEMRRISRIKTFFTAMEADGIPPEQQRDVYVAAIGDAAMLLGDKNPLLSAQWEEKYGENWREAWRDKESGFGAYFDDHRRQEAEDRDRARKDHEERAKAAFEEGDKRFTKHASPNAEGGFHEWYEDTKGNPVHFDQASASWQPGATAAQPEGTPGEAYVMDDDLPGGARDDEDIVDAEVVDDEPEEWAEPAAESEWSADADDLFDDLDDLGYPLKEQEPRADALGQPTLTPEFPAIPEGTSPERSRLLIVDAMSDFVARDLVNPAYLGGGGSAEARTQAVRVYGDQARALSGDRPYGADKASNRRASALRSMDEALAAAGIRGEDRDTALAAAHVQGVELAALSVDGLDEALASDAAANGGDAIDQSDWSEHQFTLAMRGKDSEGVTHDHEREKLDEIAALPFEEQSARRVNAVDPVKRAAERRLRNSAAVKHQRSKIHRVHIAQAEEMIPTRDQTLLDWMRDGDASSPDYDQQINDPGQTLLG